MTEEQSNKAVVILTTYWDASILIDNHYAVGLSVDNKSIYKINIESNYSVFSVALASPKNLPKNVSEIKKIDILCPTYEMLQRYKKNRDWNSFKKDYFVLLKKRKIELRRWIESLKENHIYLLCCWENTSNGSNCHRRLIYDAFCGSDYAKSKIVPIYRDGNKINKINKTTNGYPVSYSISYPDFPVSYPASYSEAMAQQAIAIPQATEILPINRAPSENIITGTENLIENLIREIGGTNSEEDPPF